jgi:hypothetical protein
VREFDVTLQGHRTGLHVRIPPAPPLGPPPRQATALHCSIRNRICCKICCQTLQVFLSRCIDGDSCVSDDKGFWSLIVVEMAATQAVILALWGALGGATNALTTKMRLRDAVRHILLGCLIAVGMGSLSMALVTSWLSLPPHAIPAGGAAGSAAYLVGVFGPAFIELVLARLRGAKGEEKDD